jgi:hypothetical protein
MSLKRAYKKAVKAGYSREYFDNIFIDRDFWIKLGEALGWEGEKIRMCVGCGVALKWNEKTTLDGKHGGKNGCGSDIYEYEGQWLIEWHRFVDHLAEGKTVHSFFKNLI